MVLFDKDAKNCDGEAYLVKKLEELKNNEFNMQTQMRCWNHRSVAVQALIAKFS